MIALVDPSLVLLSAAVAGLRVAGVTAPWYQAVAHLLVGLLFGAYLVNRERLALWLALGLTATEVVMFLWTRVL